MEYLVELVVLNNTKNSSNKYKPINVINNKVYIYKFCDGNEVIKFLIDIKRNIVKGLISSIKCNEEYLINNHINIEDSSSDEESYVMEDYTSSSEA